MRSVGGSADASPTPRFSVIVPTHERREIVVRDVAALARQRDADFEAVVVVDGAGDGTAAALRELELPFRLTVIEQENQGAAAARNAGASAARGELLLFLDDDMEADPGLLAEHDRSHREGADLVVGDMPLHPDSSRNLLSWGVGQWAATRRRRLEAHGAEPGLDDLLTGQMSITRAGFDLVEGFDTSFTREGLFGGEDIDFGYRVLQAGLRVAFNPAAISRQYYDVDPADYLRRARETGRSEAELVRKHPEQGHRLAAGPSFRTRRSRLLLGPLVAAPAWMSAPVRTVAVRIARSGRNRPVARRIFFAARTLEHRRGARAAGAEDASHGPHVLAFHAIADLAADPVLADYGVPAPRFARHLDRLAAAGWHFVDLDQTLAALDGRARLPEKSLLVTFDDAYVDLLEVACPILAARGIPALAFAVAGRTGGTNDWDRPLGARELPLLDRGGLLALAAHGVTVGSHGVNHRPLAGLDAAEAAREIGESADLLEAIGLPRPRAFSYPHGEWSPPIAAAVAASGYAAAFTVTPGRVGPGTSRFALPRIEVLARDTPLALRVKIATAGWPTGPRDRLLRVMGTRR